MRLEAASPAGVRGPVDFSAFSRLALIWASVGVRVSFVFLMVVLRARAARSFRLYARAEEILSLPTLTGMSDTANAVDDVPEPIRKSRAAEKADVAEEQSRRLPPRFYSVCRAGLNPIHCPSGEKNAQMRLRSQGAL